MPHSLKSYPPTWKGDLLLACRKCQKKLKGEPGVRALVKLKRTIQRRSQDHLGTGLHVIQVPCMDLCPKGGVTVCWPATPARLAVLRQERDIEKLYRLNTEGDANNPN